MRAYHQMLPVLPSSTWPVALHDLWYSCLITNTGIGFWTPRIPPYTTMRTELKYVNHAVRRRFPRFLFDEEIRIRVVLEDMTTYIHAQCIDLGEGGAGARTNSDLQVGETVHLQIPLSSGALRLPACVRYRAGSNYGFEFLALGTAEREYIRGACT